MKSAAEFKPVKIDGDERRARRKQLDDMPTLEETWENAKQAFVNTAEVAVQLAGRIDNLMNIRDIALKFYGDAGTMETVMGKKVVACYKDLLDLSVETYGKVLEVIEGFEMQEFLKDDMKDYFYELMPNVEDIENENQMLEAAIVFLTIKPWGEKMTALHHTMLDEKKQREYLED